MQRKLKQWKGGVLPEHPLNEVVDDTELELQID
jgi:hypothetical protein